MPPAPARILVTTRLFDDAARRLLEAGGYEVVFTGRAPDVPDMDLPDHELDTLLAGVCGWIVGVRAVTRTVLEAHPGLQVIARRGVGYDRVDVAAARELGRVVTIAAGANDAAVADHALGLMLALGKQLVEADRRLKTGDWRAPDSADLSGKTVGLVGFGRIAQGVARRLQGFEARVLVATPRPRTGVPGVEFVSLDDLLAASDVVSLHAPLTPETRHLLNGERLARMKPGALLVNTARGALVDEGALLTALETGHLAGAGLDVFEAEAEPARREATAALIAHPRVIATAHMAGLSREALARGNRIAAQCVLAALSGTAFPDGCLVVDGRPERLAG